MPMANTHSICLLSLLTDLKKTRHNAQRDDNDEDDDETECKLKCARISNDISQPIPTHPSRSIMFLISRRRASERPNAHKSEER